MIPRSHVPRRLSLLSLRSASSLPPSVSRTRIVASSLQLQTPDSSKTGSIRSYASSYSTTTPLLKSKLPPSSGFFDQSILQSKAESTKSTTTKSNKGKDKTKEKDGKDKEEKENKEPSPKRKGNTEQEPSTTNQGSAKRTDKSTSLSSSNSVASAAGGSSGNNGNDDGNNGRRGKRGGDGEERGLQKPTVPEVYPQVLALPISRRPLFPGFYKAITVNDPNVAAAITEMIKRGQPYIGTFLFKDENRDEDVIRNIDDVHDVGVFAQITSAFPIHGQEGGLTAILYPHRRIRLSSLMTPLASQTDASSTSKDKKALKDGGEETELPTPEPIPSKQSEKTPEVAVGETKGDVVASFEEGAVVPAAQQTAKRKDGDNEEQPVVLEPTSFLKNYPVSVVEVENLTEKPYDPKSPFARAVTNEIVNVFKEVASMNNLFRDQISTFSMSQTGNVSADPAKLADFAAAVSSGEAEELQEVLEAMNVEERMQKALTVLKKELMNAQLQSKISKDVENKISKRQREYWLMEQMKGIRRELGLETDGKEKLVEKFKEKADKLAMPAEVRKVFDDEIHKLAHLETAASEFNVTRNYLDWLTQIPWGQRSRENLGIQHAVRVLDEDHYGLQDVKDRILEFIAVGKLRGTVEGKILCFVGPPGVGKTSIGKSIARALNREYYRFSVGGLTDVAEIKGHRRTYVGALPGRMIQALKKCQTENPLILIDEIDKIGRGYQGDPSSALLELLDPEQNGSFLDHYLDVPVDLSKVLFVCTANMTDTLPRPLLDRMELISLSGYVADEKMAIARQYLAPAAKETAGLAKVDVKMTEEAVEELIKSYCRESGVRNLKKQIEKVYRKAALKLVRDHSRETSEEAEKAESDTESVSSSSSASSSPSSSSSSSSTSSSSSSPSSSAASSSSTSADSESVEPVSEDQKAVEALGLPDSVHVEITKDSLVDYVGPPVFTSDRLYEVNPPGVAMGLAWTQLGGAAMYVESILQASLRHDSRPHLEITGNLKNVMKESSTLAYSFAKSYMANTFPQNQFFEKASLHLHVPDGAVPKDGPSAGITMATSLLSLALEASVDPTVAMTGELTLTGKVLRIGGLREKTVAARRAGCTTILFPRDNLSDWLELPENIKAEIEGKPVGWYGEVFDIIFPNLDRQAANTSRIPAAPPAKKTKAKEAEEGEE